MDIASFIGIAGGLGVAAFGAFSGGSLGGLIDIPFCYGRRIILCLFQPISYVLGIFNVMGRAQTLISAKNPGSKLVSFSKAPRRHSRSGREIQDLDDEFMRAGLRLVVDGTVARSSARS